MNRNIFAAALRLALPLLVAAPAAAQTDDARPSRLERRGIYLGVAGDLGGQLTSTDQGGDKLTGSFGAQVRIGYAPAETFQIYLAGSVHDSRSFGENGGFLDVQLILTTANVRYIVAQGETGIAFILDFGGGLAMVRPAFFAGRPIGFGFGYSLGLGLELPLGRSFSVSPELFFRSTLGVKAGGISGFGGALAEPISGTVSAFGLQLSLFYY